MFKKKSNNKSKKAPKPKKDLKLLVVKSTSKTPAAAPTEIELSPPAAPAPPSVVQLEQLPWSEWTWDTNQHFYFRARMGHAGWEYDYNIPADYQKRREEARWYMSLPEEPPVPGILGVDFVKHRAANVEARRDDEEDSKASSSDSGTITGSVESASDSGSNSASGSESDNSSEDSDESFDVKQPVRKRSQRSAGEGSKSSVIVSTTRKNSSGEVIVEVLDIGSGSRERKNAGTLRETSDWGYTSDDDW